MLTIWSFLQTILMYFCDKLTHNLGWLFQSHEGRHYHGSFECTLECYATPWPLWRESRILWHIVETSFAFGAILSLSLPHCSLFSVFRRVNACLQARGTAIRAFTQLKNNSLKPSIFFFFWFKSENTHYHNLWTSLERREKQALRSTQCHYTTEKLNFSLDFSLLEKTHMRATLYQRF